MACVYLCWCLHAGYDAAVVQVQWDGMPEGYAQLVPLGPRTSFSSPRIFPLNYVARPGDPVTAMTARQGLRVTPNPPALMQRMQWQGAHAGPDSEDVAKQQLQQLQQQQPQGASNSESQSGAAAAAGAIAPTAAAAVVPVGTLVRPCEVNAGCVWWTVDWGAGEDDLMYQVGATHADWCDLQVR